MFNSVMELKVRVLLLLIVMRLSDAEDEKNLKGTIGGNITLPDAVLEKGFLSYGRGKFIAQVRDRKLDIDEDIYKNRLHWNKSSGLFTLTDLQRRDSGIYTIDSKTGKGFTSSYILTVYDSVAPPAVSTLSVSSDSCSLLCAVDKAAEITLWWYKDQEMVNQSSSAGPLPLTVTKQDFNSSYRCVAGNPAENKTLLVDVETSCLINPNSSSDNNLRHRWIIIGVSTLFAVAAFTLTAFLIKLKFFKKSKTTTPERQGSVDSKSEVHYAEVNHPNNRHSQGGNSPDPPGSVDHNLTTAYDQLEAHRMVLPESDGHV